MQTETTKKKTERERDRKKEKTKRAYTHTQQKTQKKRWIHHSWETGNRMSRARIRTIICLDCRKIYIYRETLWFNSVDEVTGHLTPKKNNLIFCLVFYATTVRPHCGMCREDGREKENFGRRKNRVRRARHAYIKYFRLHYAIVVGTIVN
jgi:hypothetical protein